MYESPVTGYAFNGSITWDGHRALEQQYEQWLTVHSVLAG
jgi:hypothetical protein